MTEEDIQPAPKTKDLLGKLKMLKNLVIFHMNMPMCLEARALIEEIEKSLELSADDKKS